jgi:hypothetical protein
MYPAAMYPKGASISGVEQRRVLDSVLSRARSVGKNGVAAFDLDSTLLDNRPRQARILAEYGRAHDLPSLAGSLPAHWTSWEIADAMRASGLEEGLVAVHRNPAKEYWGRHFFTSAYCVADIPMPGAREFLAELMETGVQIAYVTGRDVAMGEGSLASFRSAGFPIPDERRVHFMLKPNTELADDAWKEECYVALAHLGEVIAAFDNEPTHINGYRARFPGALCVHLATDDSGRPVPLADGIPSVATFLR